MYPHNLDRINLGAFRAHPKVCDNAQMANIRGGHRGPQSYRRLRRWAKHTPNGEIALSLFAGAAVALAAAAVLFLFFV
jgi:hypothetical protein